jgi:integrase
MPRPSSAPGIGRVRLIKRGSRWYARFQDQGKRQEKALKLTTKKRAEERAVLLNEALEKGEPWEWVLEGIRPDERTFGQVLDEYLEKGSRWAARTRRANAGTVNIIRRAFGELPVMKIDRAAIEAFLARRRDEGLSVASNNRYLCVFKAVLTKAEQWGYVRANPASPIRCTPEGKKAPRPYMPEELDRLLPELRPEHRAVVEVYLETGLRLSELASLRWADVDLAAGALTVRSPKNHRDRTVPLSTKVAQILRDRRQKWEAEPIVALEGLVYGPKAEVRQVLLRAYRRARIAPERRQWLRPVHSLRDSYITRLVEAGVPLDRVQVLAGHNSVEMTRRYALTREASLFEAVRTVFG